MDRSHRSSLLIVAGLTAGLSGFLGCEGLERAPGGAAGRLREQFPGRADQALVAVRGFEATARGFVAEARPGLTVALPTRGDEDLLFTLDDGRGVRVREEGATGDARRAEDAIAYDRPFGTSFWSIQDGGLEEWLLVEPQGVERGEPIAAWSVEGGTLREVGSAVLVLDDHGKAMLRVTAPSAHAEGGREVDLELDVRGDRVVLLADAHHERLLVDPLWAPADQLAESRSAHTATLLPDGRVVAIAGHFDAGERSSVEIYDPGLDAWTPGASATHIFGGFSRHTATLLGNGTILVAGGFSKGGNPDVAVYDPVGNTWTNRASMSAGRDGHTATPLPNGDILVTGGSFAPFGERYDPGTNGWTTTGDMSSARRFATATRLFDGRVLVVGGEDEVPLATADLFNPATNTFSPTQNDMALARIGHAAVLLEDGRVLITGGVANNFAEIFDPAVDSFTGTGSLLEARSSHAAVAVGDALVVAIGGTQDGGQTSLGSVEVYDQLNETWTFDTAMFESRFDFTATQLLDGNVLVVGGVSGFPSNLATTERYLSLLPLGKPCVDGTECNSGFCADGVCCQLACGGECEACSIAAGSLADGACLPLDGPACTGGVCEVGVCVAGGLPNGATCAAAGECTSGFCADTVCCESACSGACDACSVAMGSSEDGLCEPVSGPACSDGDSCTMDDSCVAGVCQGDPIDCVPGVCQLKGSCQGGSCNFVSERDGMPCPGGSCQAGTCIPDQLLGLGEVCEAPAQCQSDFCIDGVCCNAACGGECQACSVAAGANDDGTCGPADAVACPGGTCDAGTCVPAGGLPVGEPCETGEQCESSFCTDGVCCGIACDGECEACSVDAGAPVDGECEPQSGVACDDGDACTQVDACSAGTCVGADPVVCEVGVCQIASACGPSGACVPVSASDGTPCEGGTCIAGGCVADPNVSLSGSGSGLGSGSGPGSGTGSGDGDGDGDGDANGSGSGSGEGDSSDETGSGCAVGSGGRPADLTWIAAAMLLARGRRRTDRSRG